MRTIVHICNVRPVNTEWDILWMRMVATAAPSACKDSFTSHSTFKFNDWHSSNRVVTSWLFWWSDHPTISIFVSIAIVHPCMLFPNLILALVDFINLRFLSLYLASISVHVIFVHLSILASCFHQFDIALCIWLQHSKKFNQL